MRSRTAFTDSASQMHTARVPSGVGKVWWSLTLGGRLARGSAVFQNLAGSEIVCWTSTNIGPSEKGMWLLGDPRWDAGRGVSRGARARGREGARARGREGARARGREGATEHTGPWSPLVEPPGERISRRPSGFHAENAGFSRSEANGTAVEPV